MSFPNLWNSPSKSLWGPATFALLGIKCFLTSQPLHITNRHSQRSVDQRYQEKVGVAIPESSSTPVLSLCSRVMSSVHWPLILRLSVIESHHSSPPSTAC